LTSGVGRHYFHRPTQHRPLFGALSVETLDDDPNLVGLSRDSLVDVDEDNEDKLKIAGTHDLLWHKRNQDATGALLPCTLDPS
jgi:hypothetical protein